jgi:uncharacterized membrane protein
MKINQAADKLLQLRVFSLAALLSLGGLADSVYLTVKHLSGADVGCLASSGCLGVLSSSYTSVGRIPLGALGTLGYFVAFSLATMAAFGYSRAQTYLIVLIAGMLYTTIWLFYVQAFVLHAFCSSASYRRH